jgi:hypothetical protein
MKWNLKEKYKESMKQRAVSFQLYNSYKYFWLQWRIFLKSLTFLFLFKLRTNLFLIEEDSIFKAFK